MVETVRKHLADLKQFARAEMARDLAKRHGKSLRLPWDPDDAVSEPAGSAEPQIDMQALEELSGYGD